jgi:hypothetical protein
MSIPGRAILPLGLVFLAGCAGAKASSLAKAVIDTLPGGNDGVTSTHHTASTDTTVAGLVEEGRFTGADGTPAELGEPGSVAVDDAGRIYVVDNKPASIKVFAPDGRLVRTIGREGEGPGEFRVGFIAVHGGYLVLHDPQVARTTVWDTAGTLLRSWHDSCCYWNDIEVDREGRIYIPSVLSGKPGDAPRGIPYVRWSLEGVALDTVWVPRVEDPKFWTITSKKGGQVVSAMSTSIPFMPGLDWAIHPDGGIIYGWSGRYAIVRSRTGTDSARVFGKAWAPDPVTDELRAAEYESRIKEPAKQYGEANVRAAFKVEDLPHTLPAYLGFRVDGSGRVWVRRYPVTDTTRTFYDVFDSTGAFLGPVVVPFQVFAYGRQAWTRDGLVTIIEDDEGRPSIVQLRFVRKPD